MMIPDHEQAARASRIALTRSFMEQMADCKSRKEFDEALAWHHCAECSNRGDLDDVYGFHTIINRFEYLAGLNASFAGIYTKAASMAERALLKLQTTKPETRKLQ